MHYSYIDPERRMRSMYRRKKNSRSYIGAGSGISPNPLNFRFIKPYTLPYTLINVTIQRILGKEEYKKLTNEVKVRCQNNCEVCGRGIKLNGDYLHYLDTYDASEKGIFKFLGVIGVCRECYLYKNRYFLDTLLENGEITSVEYTSIISTRDVLLSSSESPLLLHDYALSSPTVVLYNGTKYINDFYTDLALKAYSKGVRVLNMKSNYAALPIDYYYKFIK